MLGCLLWTVGGMFRTGVDRVRDWLLRGGGWVWFGAEEDGETGQVVAEPVDVVGVVADEVDQRLVEVFVVAGEPGVEELHEFAEFGDVGGVQWVMRIGHGRLPERLGCLDVYCGVCCDVVRVTVFCRFCRVALSR